jgi:hypothetical protein
LEEKVMEVKDIIDSAKKLYLALIQPVLLLWLMSRKSGLSLHLPPKVALGKWEDSTVREKYWYIATADLPVEILYLHSPLEKKWFPLPTSPQSDFYSQLASGLALGETRWFKQIGKKYRNPSKFASKKVKILELAQTGVDFEVPVFLAGPKRALVVDGTHRSAALHSLGRETIRCQILIWYWKPRRRKR